MDLESSHLLEDRKFQEFNFISPRCNKKGSVIIKIIMIRAGFQVFRRSHGVSLSSSRIPSILCGPSSLQQQCTRSFSLDFQEIAEYDDPLAETARTALNKSCYLTIDWKIGEDEKVSEAVKRMTANNIGAMAVFDSSGDVVGLLSERDVLKVPHLGKSSEDLKVSEICTSGKANLISVTLDNPIDACMRKMLRCNVRHLLIREKDTSAIVGMISVKDIVKCALAKSDAMIDRLTGMVVESEAMRKDV